MNSALPIGTVGRALVAVTETAVLKVLPEGEVKTLSSSEFRDNRPAKHPLSAVALDGHIIGMATADHLSVVDAVSGSLLWKIDWTKDAQPIIQEARESLNVWQNLRWSSRGVSFYDGQARTLTVEWHALMAGGDLIVPIGTRTLMGLRCQP